MPKYTAGNFVVHGHEICKVDKIIKNYRDNQDFYKLCSANDSTLVTYSPVASQDKLLRPIISRKEAEKLIERIPDIDVVAIVPLNAEAIYSSMIRSGRHEDIIGVIKTSYLRCEEKARKKQPKQEKDKVYLRLAEKMLYDEFAVALDKTFDEVKSYIVKRVGELQSA